MSVGLDVGCREMEAFKISSKILTWIGKLELLFTEMGGKVQEENDVEKMGRQVSIN